MPATGVRIPGHKLVRPPVHIERYSKGYLLIYELPLHGRLARQITVPGHMLASPPVRTTWELNHKGGPTSLPAKPCIQLSRVMLSTLASAD